MALLHDISLGLIIYIVLLIITVPRVLVVKRDAGGAIAWLLFVFLTPIVGTIAFWTIGDPTLRRTIRRVMKGRAVRKTLSARQRRKVGSDRLQHVLRHLDETPATEGNLVEFINEGGVFYERLMEDLEHAQHEICIQFYIFRVDEVGRPMLALLERKAREGVRVYFLYDAMGSNHLSRRALRSTCSSGVECHPFLPFMPLRRRFQINFRNHRKLVIIDRAIAYTGGLNVGREYTGAASGLPEWFDAHVRVEGPTVPQLLDEFASDWMFAREDGHDDFNEMAEWETESVPLPDEDPRARGVVQTVSSGPDQPINSMKTMMFSVFTSARKRLWVASPYLVPDDAMMTALTTAALSGVDVRILTQGKVELWLPWFAANYFAGPLMQAGVKIYRYEKGTMHAKMALADNDFATVGSANLDVRSLCLNFELNLLFYSQHEIQEIEKIFLEAFEGSEILGDSFLNRPWWRRLPEYFCRLFAPVL